VSKSFIIAIVLTLIIVSGLVCQIITINNESVFAHKSGCHRWHSCPSDTGSYVCGDLGYDSQCPGSSKKDNDKSSSKNNDKSSSKSNSNDDSGSFEGSTAEDKSNTGDTNSFTTESNPSILSESKSYKLVSKWGGFGKGLGQFNHPASIDSDPNGQRFYIADLDNNRVQVLHSGGSFITEWGTLGKGDGQFNNPGSIAVDDENKIVFVADIKNNRIEKFDIQGKYIDQWGTLGKGDGQFDHPGDIALDPKEEILYVTDIYNNRIQAFYYDGNFITKWGSFGTGEGQFNRPAGITIDPDNNLVYISDTVNNRIQVFDSDGNFIAKWGSANGQFNRPDGIRFEPTDKLIYVADRKNHGIQVFDSEGTFLTKWTFSNIQSERQIKPRDVTMDSSGQIYVVDKENNNVLVYGQGEALLSTDTFAEQQIGPQNNAADRALSDSVSLPTQHGKSYFVENFESDPEDPIYVVSHSTKKDKIIDPIYKLVGEIKNKSDEEVTFVKIIGTFYDENGIVIGTDYTYTDPTDIKPGRTAPYTLTLGFGDTINVKDISRASYSLEWD
jgi:DNA-binding beta-propeller fold protein YncE